MCETKLRLHVVFIVIFVVLREIRAVDDTLLFTVTRAPRYFGILQDHRGQPLSVEVSEEYMDQDYIATNRKRHKIDWNKNPLEIDDFDDDDTEEILDDKDKDVKLPNKYNLQAGPV
uniref:Cac n=1 Tax=Biston betularia TaxID=82595 RepID=A0A173FDD4_BISBE|nr:cac [Biston betularia]